MSTKISIAGWADYSLLDSGRFEKLERFGNYTVRRPEPQALWDKSLGEEIWNKADAWFKREKESQKTSDDNEKGAWITKDRMPEQWWINVELEGQRFKMRLGMTAFKHVGIFPEQIENWRYIIRCVKALKKQHPKVLNLFAYTGGASIATAIAGAKVVHVDSVRPVVNWASENAKANGVETISWVVEDAVKYVAREKKRGNRYSGIILDPPAYGRGPSGEKWLLNRHLLDLLHDCKSILEDEQHFVILNLYSMGYSPTIAENLIKGVFGNQHQIESGELNIIDSCGKALPLGVFSRFIKL